MKLSICIPTFDRWPFLRWTLDRLMRDFGISRLITAEDHPRLIVSENPGSIAPNWVFEPPWRWVTQDSNIGAFPNMRAALLESHSQYAVFCADDDYLLPDEVAKGIAFLDANPEVVTYYAPCQLYDEVAGQVDPYGNAFYVASDETFTDPGKLWNFIIHNHVWPEHAIYRRSKLEAIMRPRTHAYWAFVDLANAIHEGPVHFASTPYYRNITNHPVGHRSKLGDRQCLTDFDEYRAGLENLAFDLFQKHLTPELKAKLNLMIGHFINMRLGVAHRLHVMNGRQEEALSIEKRLRICA